MSLAAVGVGAAVGGTAVQIIQARNAAKQKSRAAREQAQAKRLQAGEILARFGINAGITREEGRVFQSEQIGRAVKSGLSESSTLALLEDTQRKIDRAIELDRRDAEFRAGQLETGATIDERLARDIRKAKRLETAGIFLTGVARGAAVAS